MFVSCGKTGTPSREIRTPTRKEKTQHKYMKTFAPEILIRMCVSLVIFFLFLMLSLFPNVIYIKLMRMFTKRIGLVDSRKKTDDF